MTALAAPHGPAPDAGDPRLPAPGASHDDGGPPTDRLPALDPPQPGAGAAPLAAHPSPGGERGPGWHPAPFALLLHHVAEGAVIHLDGPDALAGARCGQTATAHPAARGGPRNWSSWPRCPDCAGLADPSDLSEP